METQIFKISGMGCDHCVKAVENELRKTGIKNFTVQIGSAKVEYEDSSESKTKIKSAIENTGYKVVE